MILIKIRRHLRHDGMVVISVPEEGNPLMGRFGPARLSPSDRGYLLADDQVDALQRFLARHPDVRVLDERDVTEPAPVGQLPYVPLPECADCGHPVDRDQADTLDFCPRCGEPWVAYQAPTWTPDRGPQDPRQAAAEAAAALDRLSRGVQAARTALGPRRMPPADAAATAAARRVRCPWCGAEPGVGCYVLGTGRPLTITAAHPARHEAAGVGTPRIVTDELAARRTARKLAPPEPDPADNGHAQRAAGDR